MKKWIIFLCCVCFLWGCQNHQPISDNEKMKIVVTSDIHYFLKDYYKDCEWFEESMLYGDGKMVTYADEILDVFIKTMKRDKPDLVVITGDLSFYGEKGSHKKLAEILQELKNVNIDVAVLPGNHDIDSIFKKGYGKDDYFDVDNVSAKEFKTIYKNLGYDIGRHEHDQSLSYRIDLNQRYSLLMVDTNYHELTGSAIDQGGLVTQDTLKWLTQQLKDVQNNNKVPLVAMHHSLIDHNQMLNQKYTIQNSEEVVELLKKYQVPLTLSGHIHCQNIKEKDGIYDIASSSLLDAPLQYGTLDIDNHKIDYHTDSLKISIDANDYFDTVSRNAFQEKFNEIEDEKMRNEMLDVLVKANRYYFAGNLWEHKKELEAMSGYHYYKDQGEKVIHFKNYLDSLMSDHDNNQELHLTID